MNYKNRKKYKHYFDKRMKKESLFNNHRRDKWEDEVHPAIDACEETFIEALTLHMRPDDIDVRIIYKRDGSKIDISITKGDVEKGCICVLRHAADSGYIEYPLIVEWGEHDFRIFSSKEDCHNIDELKAVLVKVFHSDRVIDIVFS